jgi:heptosyltransferase-2
VKLLVRATNWVGDAVMCIPALAAVRARWPQAQIAILARPWVAGLYHGQGLADRIMVIERPGKHSGFAGGERLAAELRAAGFDTALLLQNAFEAAWLVRRAGIPERIGYARDGRGWLLTQPVPVPQPGEIPAHEANYYLELLRRAGWLDQLPSIGEVRLRLDPASLERAESTLREAGARGGSLRVAFAPGAAYGSAKCWPTERYAALADRLIAAADADVILFGAPAERDVCQRIARGMKHRAVMLAGQTGIDELPALLARCRLFVGNDSGAMHVAAAVGLPVVAVFGPTDANATAPLTPQFTLLQEPVSCSPCFLRHCPVDHRCMARVDVERVYAAARERL